MSRTATEQLRTEHRLILRVVSAFERMLDGLRPAADGSGTRDLPMDDLDRCITFFRLFTDACHHGKEEDVLFAALEEQGLPGDAGPIGALRDEHREGRAMVRAMLTALALARGGDAAALHALLERGADYIAFIRSHIGREDDGVFEMADRIVGGAACDAVCAAYETVCSRRFEGLTLQDLEAGAADLIERYAS